MAGIGWGDAVTDLSNTDLPLQPTTMSGWAAFVTWRGTYIVRLDWEGVTFTASRAHLCVSFPLPDQAAELDKLCEYWSDSWVLLFCHRKCLDWLSHDCFGYSVFSCRSSFPCTGSKHWYSAGTFLVSELLHGHCSQGSQNAATMGTFSRTRTSWLDVRRLWSDLIFNMIYRNSTSTHLQFLQLSQADNNSLFAARTNQMFV